MKSKTFSVDAGLLHAPTPAPSGHSCSPSLFLPVSKEVRGGLCGTLGRALPFYLSPVPVCSLVTCVHVRFLRQEMGQNLEIIRKILNVTENIGPEL